MIDKIINIIFVIKIYWETVPKQYLRLREHLHSNLLIIILNPVICCQKFGPTMVGAKNFKFHPICGKMEDLHGSRNEGWFN